MSKQESEFEAGMRVIGHAVMSAAQEEGYPLHLIMCSGSGKGTGGCQRL